MLRVFFAIHRFVQQRVDEVEVRACSKSLRVEIFARHSRESDVCGEILNRLLGVMESHPDHTDQPIRRKEYA